MSSTSLSGGNLVDGLPPASSNTGAAPASWKPKKCRTIYNFPGFFLEVTRGEEVFFFVEE